MFHTAKYKILLPLTNRILTNYQFIELNKNIESTCKNYNKGSVKFAQPPHDSQDDNTSLDLPPDQLLEDNYQKPEFVNGANNVVHDDFSINSPELLSADPMNSRKDQGLTSLKKIK